MGTRKTRRSKRKNKISRISCKHGKLKRSVKTKSGRRRKCKKRKSKKKRGKKKSKSRKCKKKSKKKRGKKKRSYKITNCKQPVNLSTCKGGEDIITLDEITSEDDPNNYLQFQDDKGCTSKDNWNQWIRNFRQHKTMATNPSTRTKTWCSDVNPENVLAEPTQNDSWLTDEQIDYITRNEEDRQEQISNLEKMRAYVDDFYSNSLKADDVDTQEFQVYKESLRLRLSDETIKSILNVIENNESLSGMNFGDSTKLLMIFCFSTLANEIYSDEESLAAVGHEDEYLTDNLLNHPDKMEHLKDICKHTIDNILFDDGYELDEHGYGAVIEMDTQISYNGNSLEPVPIDFSDLYKICNYNNRIDNYIPLEV
jgi:hypothetical protein